MATEWPVVQHMWAHLGGEITQLNDMDWMHSAHDKTGSNTTCNLASSGVPLRATQCSANMKQGMVLTVLVLVAIPYIDCATYCRIDGSRDRSQILYSRYVCMYCSCLQHQISTHQLAHEWMGWSDQSLEAGC